MQSGEQANGGDRAPNGNGHTQQYANAVLSERMDALVYGFLRRTGYNEAADCLEQESPFLANSLSRPRSNSRSIVTVNDRVHDHTLEQIIQLFCQDGQFGVNQNLLEFGEELRRLTNRYTSLTSTNSPGRSHLHQQLYGRPAYSRQTHQNYSLRPAPQALAQMELQQIAQIGEMRYREEQQQAHFKQMQTKTQEHQINRRQEPSRTVPAPLVTTNPLNAETPLQQQLSKRQNQVSTQQHQYPSEQQQLPLQQQQVPQQPQQLHQEDDVEFVHSSQSAEGSSRRKLHHPQNYKAKVLETVIDPLVGLINDRPWNDMDNLHLADDDAFFQSLDVIDKNFLAMYDYEQPSNDVDHIFEEMLASPSDNVTEALNESFDPASLPVEEEVVVNTTVEASQMYNFANLSPPLSPLPKSMSFGRREESSLQERAAPMVVDNLTLPKKSETSTKQQTSDSGKVRSLTEERGREKERKDRRSGEQSSSRKDSPRRRSNDTKRRGDDKKKHHRDKERERDRSTHREFDKRREEHDSASTHRHSSKHRHIVQSDRESTSSSSCRATRASSETADTSNRKDGGRRRRDKEKDKKRRIEHSEKERASAQTSSNFDKKQGGDLLNKVREAHAAGTRSSDARRENEGRDASSSKRKADEMLSSRKDFKIPKKASCFTSKSESKASYGAHMQSGPLIRETVSQSSSTSKRERERAALSAEVWQAQEIPIATHYIVPRGHVVRLSSMLVNADKSYAAFQSGLRRSNKDSQVVDEDALSDIASSPPSDEKYPKQENSNFAETSQTVRPTKPTIAPRKGFLLNKTPSNTPLTAGSSSDEADKDSADEYDLFPQRELSRKESESPEPKRNCREIDMEKAKAMLNRIHGPEE